MTYIGQALPAASGGGFAGEACDEAQGLTAGLRGSLREEFTGNRITMKGCENFFWRFLNLYVCWL